MIKLKLIIFFFLNWSVYFSFKVSDKQSTTVSSNSPNNETNEVRKAKVKEAFTHAWNGYKTYAWGKDELKPLTNSSNERFQNWGATLVDSLTTLWLMDLKEEFNEAVEAVEKIDFTKSNGKINFFETTIRYLGGLIGAYDLSGNKILLKQAVVLADLLMVAFKSPTGIPYSFISWKHKEEDAYTGLSLAAIGSCQMEFTRLTQITNDTNYEKKAMAVIDHLDRLKKSKIGLWPAYLDPVTGEFNSLEITFGAVGDSFYEYLIKVYMLTNKTNAKLKRMYLESIEGFKLLTKTREDGLTYFTRINKFGTEERVMDHLSLFMGGLLQYGDFVLNTKDNSELGLKIAYTGYQFINTTRTKLAPETVFIPESGPIETVEPVNNLRPELLETLFYSWRFTKKQIYRDQAWEIFEAFNKYSKTPSGFAVYENVQNADIKHQQLDVMESFFFAETLKYLYLIFSEDSTLDLSRFVLNTEAHPLKIAESQ